MSVIATLIKEARAHETEALKIRRAIAMLSADRPVRKSPRGRVTRNRSFSVQHYADLEGINYKAAAQRLTNKEKFERVARGRYKRIKAAEKVE
jgi:hypothetical protein